MRNHRTLKLAAANQRDFTITRVFDAPRALVFDALTRPDMLRHWFQGPPGWWLVDCQLDLRVGGIYRFAWQDGEGNVFNVRGTYRAIVVPERIVAIETFDRAWHAGEAVVTTALSEQGGKTTLSRTILDWSTRARERSRRTESTLAKPVAATDVGRRANHLKLYCGLLGSKSWSVRPTLS